MRSVILVAAIFIGTTSGVRAGPPARGGGRLGDKSADSLKERMGSKIGFTVSTWAYRRLRDAQKLVSDEKYNEALAVLREMRSREKLNDHERALMWQTFAFVWSGKEQYAKAADSFEKCLALRALPAGGALNALYNLGQMYMAAERFNKAVEVFSEWLTRAKNPAPSAYYLIAVTYTQIKRYRDALRHVRRANQASANPPESWLQLQLSLHFELEQYAELAGVLKRLIPRYPKKTYWVQLSAVYAELGDQPRALAVLELAHLQGLVSTRDELLNLARRYLSQGMPLRAASVVEQGLDSCALTHNLT
ncbi:MAG: CDC27 family protein, partial [Myxococcota bacterium]